MRAYRGMIFSWWMAKGYWREVVINAYNKEEAQEKLDAKCHREQNTFEHKEGCIVDSFDPARWTPELLEDFNLTHRTHHQKCCGKNNTPPNSGKFLLFVCIVSYVVGFGVCYYLIS